MLDIIDHLGNIDDLAVKSRALSTLKALGLDDGTMRSLPYLLRNRLPLPTSSPTLVRAQQIRNVEYDIHQLQLLRLRKSRQSAYVPPLAKPDLKAKDDDLFSLMEKVQGFLASKRQVMLVLGDFGSGKSTFNRHLEHYLWTDYKQGDPIPLYINLPSIDRPQQDMITKQLKFTTFPTTKSKSLNSIISSSSSAMDTTRVSKWPTSIKPTSSTSQGSGASRWSSVAGHNFLDPPTSIASSLSWMTDMPLLHKISSRRPSSRPSQKTRSRTVLSSMSKIPRRRFCSRISPSGLRRYMDKLAAISHVMDLVNNPLLLTLALKTLPRLVASNKDLSNTRVTRADFYDMFVDQRLEKNRVRLQTNMLSRDEMAAFNVLMDGGFIGCGVKYLQRLSAAIFEEQEGNPVVQYVHVNDKHTWKADFFGTVPEIKLLRDSCPLTRTDNQYRFFSIGPCSSIDSLASSTPQPGLMMSVIRTLKRDPQHSNRSLLTTPCSSGTFSQIRLLSSSYAIESGRTQISSNGSVSSSTILRPIPLLPSQPPTPLRS